MLQLPKSLRINMKEIEISVITTKLEPVTEFTAPTVPREGEEVWDGDDTYVVEDVFWEEPETPRVQLRVRPLRTPATDKQLDTEDE